MNESVSQGGAAGTELPANPGSPSGGVADAQRHVAPEGAQRLHPDDVHAVQAFMNFLSWNVKPARPGITPSRNVPPAWWAYALGFTRWCPAQGEW